VSLAWQVVVDLGWQPRAELRPEERGYYQALWALADEARDAEAYVVRLSRRATRRALASSTMTARRPPSFPPSPASARSAR
jgi:hypothetical protein